MRRVVLVIATSAVGLLLVPFAFLGGPLLEACVLLLLGVALCYGVGVPAARRGDRERSRRLRLVCAAYAVLTVVATLPLFYRLDQLAGPPEDNQMFAWNLWYAARVVFDGHDPFHTDLLFHPHGVDLTFNTLSYANGLLSLPLQGLGLAFAYDALVLMTFTVGALGMYLLGEELLGRDVSAATFVMGLVFAFSSFHLARAQHHLNLCSIEAIPFFLLAMVRLLREPRWGDALLAACAAAFTFWASATYGLYLALFAIGFVAWETARRRGDVLSTRTLSRLAGGAALAAVLVSPLAVRMLVASRGLPPDVHASQSMDLGSYFVPNEPALSLVGLARPEFSGHPWENTAYLGATVLVLAALGLFRPHRHRFVWLATAVFFGVLSLGPTLRVMGTDTGLPLPHRLLESVPLLSALRTPSRAAVMVTLGVAVLAGPGFLWLQSRLRRSPWLLAALIAPLVLLETTLGPMPTTDVTPHAFYQELAARPGGGAVYVLPDIDQEWMTEWRNNERFMVMQTVHGRPITRGVIARVGTADVRFLEETRSVVGGAALVAHLARHGVRFVVVEKRLLAPGAAYRLDDAPFARKLVDDEHLTVFEVY